MHRLLEKIAQTARYRKLDLLGVRIGHEEFGNRWGLRVVLLGVTLWLGWIHTLRAACFRVACFRVEVSIDWTAFDGPDRFWMYPDPANPGREPDMYFGRMAKLRDMAPAYPPPHTDPRPIPSVGSIAAGAHWTEPPNFLRNTPPRAVHQGPGVVGNGPTGTPVSAGPGADMPSYPDTEGPNLPPLTRKPT